jgi:type VI secretion system protein ImpL
MTNPAALIGIPAVVVCGTVAGLMWWRQKKAQNQSKPLEPAQEMTSSPPLGADTSQIHALFRDAENKLKLSARMKGSSVSTLPVFLVVGPRGTGKTSIVLHAGVDPELLAGQVYQGSDVLPTRGLNIWLARGTIFIEVSAATASEESTVKAVFKHMMPGAISSGFRRSQPPRGIVLCADQGVVGSAETPDEVIALARPWNQFVSLAAGTLGVQLPTYVLFTKADGLGGFQEFFSNLSQKDLTQAVGATIRPFSPGAQAVYAEDTSRLLTQHFLDIVYRLCDCRLPLLNREPDRARVALEYEFPRDLSKLQKNVVQFLLEVARPSQLQVSPFLRGFYFCGTRKVLVDRPEGAAVAVEAMPANTETMAATRVMNAEQLKTQMSGMRSVPSSRGQREITEWLFLPALFDGVILRDRPAHRISATSSRKDRVRAVALAIAGTLGMALLFALTISYVRNRELELELVSAAKALGDNGSSISIFARLERMRKPVGQLLSYRSHPAGAMGWGLYRGSELLGPAQAAYCAAIRNQLLPAVFQRMSTRLASIARSGGDPAADFRYLKAYMMMTTYPQNAQAAFLSQELFAMWGGTGGPATLEVSRFLPAQLHLYGALLPIPDAQNYCVLQASPAVISEAQRYLRGLNADDRYRSLLQRAGEDLIPVDYGKLFPNDAVEDPKIVPGYFTPKGWVKMQDILNHPEQLKADAWVLNALKDLTDEELSSLAGNFRNRYLTEYAQAWKDFLFAARVTPYANPSDAVAKLEKMSSQDSKLLSLIGLVAEHTASVDTVKTVFQPAKAVVPTQGDFLAANEYLAQLNVLKNRLAKYARSSGTPHDQDLEEVRSVVSTAEDSVDKIAAQKTFKGETYQIVKEILLKPIKQVDLKPDSGQMNAEGAALCHSYEQLSRRLPFSLQAEQDASVADIQQIFQPEKGQMWRFFDQFLRDSLDCSDAGCIQKSNPKFQLSRNFVAFFNSLNRWSRLLYGGNQDLLIRLRARARPHNYLKKVEIVYGDRPVTLPANGTEFQPINWDPGRAAKLEVSGEFEGEPGMQILFGPTTGPWELFRWLFDVKQGSGGSDGFTWLPTSGRVTPARLTNGQTKEYKLELQTADGSHPFNLHYLAIGSCAPPIAR